MEILRNCPWLCLYILAFVQLTLQDDAATIHDSLMQGYNRRLRPGMSTQNALQMNMKPHVNAIKDINMKQQTVDAELSVRLQWRDTRLSWNESSFENISWITIETEKIWTPDLVLSSHNASRQFVDAGKYLAKVRSDGWVDIWVFIKAELAIDIFVSKYPFDEQVIEFAFESWTYSTEDMEFQIDTDFNPVSGLKRNGEWDVHDFVIINKDVIYSNGEHYHQAGCRIFAKRRVLYYVVHVLGPVLLISLLNILCFVLPTSSGERVSLSMTIFLTLTVIMSVISDSLPMTSLGLPIIVVYLSLQMTGSAFTIAMTVILISYSQTGSNHHIPKFIKRIILHRCCKQNKGKSAMKIEHGQQEYELQVHANTLKTLNNLKDSLKSLSDEMDRLDGDLEESSSHGEDTLTWEAVSSCVNDACFWLAILWNVALLAMLLIYVAL